MASSSKPKVFCDAGESTSSGKSSSDTPVVESGNDKEQQMAVPLAEYKLPLVWIDLEMTGLNIEVDRIIEIACIITVGNLSKSVEGPDLVMHQTQECLDKMGDWCQTHHGASGLTSKVLQSKISEQEAEKEVIQFVRKRVDTYTPLLAGNSVYVDYLFLKFNRNLKLMSVMRVRRVRHDLIARAARELCEAIGQAVPDVSEANFEGNLVDEGRVAAGVVQHQVSAQYDGNRIHTGTKWSVSGSIISIEVDLSQICSNIIQQTIPGPSKFVGQLETTGANPQLIRSDSEQQGYFSQSNSGVGISGNGSQELVSKRTGQLVSNVHDSISRDDQCSSKDREGTPSRFNSSSLERIGSMPSKKQVLGHNLQHVVFGTIGDGTRVEEARAYSDNSSSFFDEEMDCCANKGLLLDELRQFEDTREGWRISPMSQVPRLSTCKMFLFSRSGWGTFFKVGPSYW